MAETDMGGHVLGAIRAFWEAHRYAPSTRDLQEMTDASSSSVIHYWLVRLRDAGDIDFDDGVSRSVRLTGGR